MEAQELRVILATACRRLHARGLLAGAEGNLSCRLPNGDLLVTASGVDYFNFCTPAQPNARNTESYPCTDPKKNWIMVEARDLGGPGTKFPGTSNVEKRTRTLCAKLGKRYNGGSSFPSWWGIWPTERGWKEGRREAQCLVPLSQYNKEVAPGTPAA